MLANKLDSLIAHTKTRNMFDSDIKDNRSHKKRASVSEKGLYLINNNKAWEQLKQEIRASGCVTNGAARIMIIEYLLQMPDPNEEVIAQYDGIDDRARKLSRAFLLRSARSVYTKMKKRSTAHNHPLYLIHQQDEGKQVFHLICNKY